MNQIMTTEQKQKIGEDLAREFSLREALDANGRRYKPARYATIKGSKTAVEIFNKVMEILKK